MSADLIKALLARRESWLELGDARRVLLRRPAEMQLAQFRGGFRTEHAVASVVGWEGFTVRDCGGDSDAAAPFDSALWGALVEDNVAWFEAVATKVIGMVEAHLASKEAATGN